MLPPLFFHERGKKLKYRSTNGRFVGKQVPGLYTESEGILLIEEQWIEWSKSIVLCS
jgi:hypothetical protein